MAAAAILNNKKSPHVGRDWSGFVEIWHVKILKILKSNITAAAIWKNPKIAISRPRFERATNCHTSVLLVHFELYDYAVYCTVRICSIIFIVNSDANFLVGRDKYAKVVTLRPRITCQ